MSLNGLTLFKLIQNFINVLYMKIFNSCKALLLFTLVSIVIDGNSQAFKINGRIEKDSDSSLVFLNYFDNDLNDNKSDTVFTKNGIFSFSGKLIGACGASINIEKKGAFKKYSYFFVIEPGQIDVIIKGSAYDTMEVIGSVAHKEYELLQRELLYERTELNKISDSSRIISDLLINALIDENTAKKMKEEINKKTPALYNAELQKQIAYVKAHPESYISLMSLSYFLGRNPEDSIDAWYTSISNKVKGGNMDKSFLKRYLKYRKAISAEYPFDKLKLHEPAPDFLIYQNDTNDTLKINDFIGKIVVLELWGLSCIPCLYSNLALEKVRTKYNNDQIKIISLAKTFPGDVGPIQSYIKKNKFDNWLHVVLNNDANEDLGFLLEGDFSKYIGLGIPRTIIIDQEGKLAYKSYGYSETQVAEVDKLISELIHRYSK